MDSMTVNLGKKVIATKEFLYLPNDLGGEGLVLFNQMLKENEKKVKKNRKKSK